MTNRREFLHIGVVALSLPIAARAGVSPEMFSVGDRTSGDGAPTEPIYKAYFDERFRACAAFAEEMNHRALPIQAIRGDITDVWFSDLSYRWKQAPVAIAGMTAPGPIFCLEMLARDAGMRVALRVDHRWLSDGRMEHEFAGPEEVFTRAAASELGDTGWPERMAEIIAQFPAERGRAAKLRFSEADIGGSSSGPDHLVTWVIAPAQRA